MTKQVVPFQKSVGKSWSIFQLTEAYRFLVQNGFLWCSSESKKFAEFDQIVYCLGQSPEEVEGDLGDYFLREDFEMFKPISPKKQAKIEAKAKFDEHAKNSGYCYCKNCADFRKSKED